MATKAIVGGLLHGVGTGMVAQAEQRREEALERARDLRRQREREEDRNFQRETRQEDREFQQQTRQEDREFQGGLLSQIDTDESGRRIGITRTGEEKPLSYKAPMKGKKDGAGGLSSSDRNLMERVAQNYWGKMNAEGQFIMPEEARDKYVQTLERAGELAEAAGVPITTATRIAAMSISGPMSEDEAKQQAEKEAAEQISGWGKGDERDQYIKTRAPELMRESRVALEEYERYLGRGGTGAGTGVNQQQTGQAQSGQSASGTPPGQGTRGDPYKATTQQHVDWFLNNAPSGAVIEADGKMYTK